MKRTAEEWAQFVGYTCADFCPARGYAMDEYDGRPRLENIAGMVENMKLNVTWNESLQLMNYDLFNEVHSILEWNNCHTENIAFSLAFGDAAAVMDALKTIHYMGQNHAITAGAKYPTAV